MSFKGTASKSSSGASMSKYDVEVEGRLQALEKQAVKEEETLLQKITPFKRTK